MKTYAFKLALSALLFVAATSSLLRGNDISTDKQTVHETVRKLLVDADRSKRCFEDGRSQGRNNPHDADFNENPWLRNNDRGDWGKCLPEEVFGVLCVHENAHGLNDGSWALSDGPLHDGPAQALFLKLQQLHDDYCVHVNVNIPDNVQESFNDFFFARDAYTLGNSHFSEAGKIVITVTPTDNGKKYTQNGVLQPVLTMVRGNTYVFDTSDPSNAGHPLSVRISDGVDVGGVVVVGMPGSAGSSTTVTVPLDAPDELTYYCTEHVGMGTIINVIDPAVETIVITVTSTANGNKYTQNGITQPPLTMVRGNTYVFDTSDSTNAGHPLSVRVSDNVAVGGVSTTGSPGFAGSSTVFTVPLDAPDELTYYCLYHNGMGTTITVTDAPRRLEGDMEHAHDHGDISYEMACTQTYPGNPRMALQMSLYCLLGYIDQSIDTSIVHRNYGLSPTCDTILRQNMRNQLTYETVLTPKMFCESDSVDNTCTVHPDIRTTGVNTCDKYCAQFENLECRSAAVNSWSDQCTEKRPWTCDAPAMDNTLMCTCGEVATPFVAPADTAVTTACAKQMLPSDYPPYRFCNQDLEADTCSTQARLSTLESGTCKEYCESHELECVAAYDDWNCIGYREYTCESDASSYMICKCAQPEGAIAAPTITTPNCDSYCALSGKVCLSSSATLEADCMIDGVPCPIDSDYATLLEYVCGEDIERPELVDEMDTASCAHMMFYRDPVSRPSTFCPPHTLSPAEDDSCTVLAYMPSISSAPEGRTCDAYCASFAGMKCVGAAEEVSNDCNVKETLTCDQTYSSTTSDLLCACAIDDTAMPAVVAAANAPISAACENMMLSPSKDLSAKVSRVCESFPTQNTCTALAYVRNLPARSCNEFCSSFHDMECVAAAADKSSTCNEDYAMTCDAVTTSNDLLCTCGFKTNAARATYFDMGPVFEKNAVRTCPVYEEGTNSEGNTYHTNEAKRKYTMVDLTLDVDEVGSGAASVTAVDVRPDYSNSDIDTYNTAHVEACDGFESQIREGDPEEKCSFGHRLDKTQNCYGKVYGQNFAEASAACAERGGHIVRIDDDAEYALLKEIFGNQRFNVGLHDVGGRDWEWDGYSGVSAADPMTNPYAPNTYPVLGTFEKEDCVSVELDRDRMIGKYCYERDTYMCEGIRDPVTGMGGDLMADEGGFCLWYLDDPTLELPDDEDNGFTNTELAHFLLYDEDKRTRKYIELYDTLYPASNIPGHAENAANWEDFTYRKLGINSDEPLVEQFNHNKSYHCHFSPTNFGIARIYIQQHMLERIYPGSMHKHCFCGYKHLGHFVDRCDCTRSGERNGQCQKHHRQQLWTETYHQTGEYVYCNNNNCEQASP